jgi:glycosyl transferase family 25
MQNIDHIFYINLDRRQDRRNEIEAELAAMNIIAERFSAIPHNSGIVGCTQSHLAVLKLAKSRGYRNVLIFEDDFTFIVKKQAFDSYIEDFFKGNIPFDVLMLAYNINEGRIETVSNNLIVNRILSASTASGYLVSKHYLDTLIELYEWAIPLLESTQHHWLYANDRAWSSLQLRDIWYALPEKIGKQRAGWSDNAECWMDYDT